jgi:hypothetical protein
MPVQSAGIEKNSVWTGISVGPMVGCVGSVGFGPAVGVDMGAQPANMSMTMATGTMTRPRPIFDVNSITPNLLAPAHCPVKIL